MSNMHVSMHVYVMYLSLCAYKSLRVCVYIYVYICIYIYIYIYIYTCMDASTCTCTCDIPITYIACIHIHCHKYQQHTGDSQETNLSHTYHESTYKHKHIHTCTLSKMSAKQARAAAQHGARFVTSPTNPKGFVDACHTEGALAIPGVMTPTELYAASKCACMDIYEIYI